jgi:hypothetical protein
MCIPCSCLMPSQKVCWASSHRHVFLYDYGYGMVSSRDTFSRVETFSCMVMGMVWLVCVDTFSCMVGCVLYVYIPTICCFLIYICLCKHLYVCLYTQQIHSHMQTDTDSDTNILLTENNTSYICNHSIFRTHTHTHVCTYASAYSLDSKHILAHTHTHTHTHKHTHAHKDALHSKHTNFMPLTLIHICTCMHMQTFHTYIHAYAYIPMQFSPKTILHTSVTSQIPPKISRYFYDVNDEMQFYLR